MNIISKYFDYDISYFNTSLKQHDFSYLQKGDLTIFSKKNDFKNKAMFLLQTIRIIFSKSLNSNSLTAFNKEISSGNISKASKIIQELFESTKENSTIVDITFAEFLLKTGEYEKLINLFEKNDKVSTIVSRAKFNQKKFNEKKYKSLLNSSPYFIELLKNYVTECLQKDQTDKADEIFLKLPCEYKTMKCFKELKLVYDLLKLDFKEEHKKIMSSLLVPKKYITLYERMFKRVKNVLNNSINNVKEDTFKLKEFTNRLETLQKNIKEELFGINVYRPLYLKMLDILITSHRFPEYGSFIEKIVNETGDMEYRKLHIKYLVFKNQNEEALRLINEYNIKDPTFKSEIQININREKEKLKELREREIQTRKAKNPQDSKGYYKILGCNPWDPQEVVKENYREKLKKMKEIKDPSLKERETMKLTQAFDALKNETVRAEYDEGPKNFYNSYNNRKTSYEDDNMGGFDEIFDMLNGGGRRRRTYFRFG